MNQNPFEMTVENPWKQKGNIPYPNFVRLVPVMLLYILAAMSLAFFGIPQFAMISFVAMCAGVIYVARFPRIVLTTLLLGFIPAIMTQSFAIGALVLGVVVSTACGALLMTATKSPWRMLLLPAVAWTVVFAITRDATYACTTLLTLPASALLTAATLTGQRRTGAVCYTTGGLLLAVLILLVVYFTRTYGAIDRDVIFAHFENQRAWLVEEIIKARDEGIRLLGEQGQSELVGTMQSVLSRETVTALIAAIYNVLPALIVVGCSILGYQAQTLLCSGYCTMDMKKMLTPQSLTFTMGVVSAILYLLASLISNFLPNGIVAAVLQNFSIMLTPGFFLVGYASILFRYRASKGFSKFLYIFIFIFILFFNPFLIFSLLALFGAISVLLAVLGAHMIKKMQGNIMQGNARQDSPFYTSATEADEDEEADDCEENEENDTDAEEETEEDDSADDSERGEQ